MTLPRWLALLNRPWTNPVLIHLARIPPFAAVRHRGRRTGRIRRTPVNAFPCGRGFVIPVTHPPGLGTQRVGGGRRHPRVWGRARQLVGLELVSTRALRHCLPLPIRWFPGVLRLAECLRGDVQPATHSATNPAILRRARRPSPRSVK